MNVKELKVIHYTKKKLNSHFRTIFPTRYFPTPPKIK